MISKETIRKTIGAITPFTFNPDTPEVRDLMHDYYTKLGWHYIDKQMIWTRKIHVTDSYDLTITGYGNPEGFEHNTVIIFQVSLLDGEVICNDYQATFPHEFEKKVKEWAVWIYNMDADICADKNLPEPTIIDPYLKNLLEIE